MWCLALDGKSARIKCLPVRDSGGNLLSSAVAAAIQVETADGQKRILAANPEQLSISVEPPDKTECRVEEIFAVK